MIQARVFLLIMDSLGIGASADAVDYGDQQANTLLHIVEECKFGRANKDGVRTGELKIPNLASLGIFHAMHERDPLSMDISHLNPPVGCYGHACEQSLGKDTPSGHWEIAGVPVLVPWGYFPDTPKCFPQNLIQELITRAKLPGVLAECHASGTEVIAHWGDEHVRTGKPIVYTSGDSVLQIAAHESSFGLQRLYDVCEIARELVDEYAVGRVIARPFTGSTGCFVRSGHRRDYSSLPPEKTLLDFLKTAGRAVVGIGKISDIFAHQGITQSLLAHGNMALFDTTLSAMDDLLPGSLLMTNFVDFDSSYGHRRDVIGYAHALEVFDARLPSLIAKLKPDDLLIISADHGCDPTFPGSDHTREDIPVLVYGHNLRARSIGKCSTFADIGQSIAHYLSITPLSHGVSFL